MEDTCYINHHPDKNTPGYEWDFQCARCGSSINHEVCSACDGDGIVRDEESDDCGCECDVCEGKGEFVECMSSEEFCLKHPLPGREHIQRGAIEYFEVKIMNPDGN